MLYQFYYAENQIENTAEYKKKVSDCFSISAIRPAMWEEHCLECSAPQCYETCAFYEARRDGRCKRFYDGYEVYAAPDGCCGQGVRLRFRKWANMMTVLFPAYLSPDEYLKMTKKNQELGKRLQKIVRSKLPQQIRWQTIRTREFIRRRSLRRLENQEDSADAFIFHGYSFSPEPYRLILEVYSDGLSQYRKSLFINQGENLIILNQNELNGACWKPGNIVKVYPENNYEAELDILWCDFVKGHPIAQEKPAEKVKCVVWDLDNTLWDGTLIETENAKDLIISETVKNTIYRLDERGIIQSVASKNDFEQAWPVVEASGLSEYFIYPQINWGAKSNSMTEIAHNLNIGLDTFALIDDSPFEKNEVRNRCPQIRVYEPCELNVLLDKPEFDVPITNESRRRRLLYKAEEKRNFDKAVNNAGTIEFLESCHLETKVFIPETDEEILRCFELLSRTNQLNMSGKKYSEAEFDLLLKDPNRSSYAFSCKDDYGEYGIVGFLQYHVSEGMLIIDEFAMSCRVAGKYVESSLFTYLLHKENCEKGCITVIKTTKNGLLRKTLEGIGFRRNTETEHIICYSFSDDLDEAKLVDTGVRIK